MERTGFEQWSPREVARLLALVETEKRYYQEMVASLPAALVVLSGDRSIVSANRAFRQLVGLRTEDLRQKTIDQILPSHELIERIRAAHVNRDNRPFFLNMGQREFRIAIVPIRSWEDEMEAETLLMVEDLSGIEAVRAAAPPRIAGFDPSGFPAFVWQADASTLRFTYAGGAEDILGYPAPHWLATPEFFSERIHPDDRSQVMTLYHATIASGGEASAEYRALSSSGVPVWCRESIRVPAPGEAARTIAGVMSGIGRRKQLEEHTLTSARMEGLREVAARLAHDLNNPLMIVTGYAEEMLNALPANDPLRSDIAEMLAATNRISEMAGHLLGFTRRVAKPPVPVSMNELIQSLASPLRQTAGHSAQLELPPPAPAVFGLADRDQLADAILALASAAFENTRQVSLLRLACHTELIPERVPAATLKPGSYARIDIHAAGQGSGTPATALFESFLTGRDAAARAYWNVREWGGDISFSSDPAQGSTVTVYLPHTEPEQPKAEPEPAVPERAPEPGPVPVETAPEPKRDTVMIVEDEPGIRALVRKILRRENYNVLEAGSAEEALEVASRLEGAIDLLLTDVILPGMGGRELAESLRDRRPQMKVVYVSGYTDDEGVRLGEFPPGSRFLQKPFTLGALTGKVREALED